MPEGHADLVDMMVAELQADHSDRLDVVVVGSANLDLVARAHRHPAPGETVHGVSFDEFAGGKGLNQAVAAARSGARTGFAGALGDDDAGRRLLGVLSTDAIASGDVNVVAEVPTGRAMVTLDDAGENTIVIIAGANATVSADHPMALASVVVSQLEIPIDAVLGAFSRARKAGATTILNPAPAAELPASLLGVADYVIPNEHELGSLGGVDRVLEAGVRAVITTLGAAGVRVTTADESWELPAFTVTPVDTTGAGDAFCGSFAARIAAGDDLSTAVRWAAAAGALATTKPGAVPGQPYRADIEALLAFG